MCTCVCVCAISAPPAFPLGALLAEPDMEVISSHVVIPYTCAHLQRPPCFEVLGNAGSCSLISSTVFMLACSSALLVSSHELQRSRRAFRIQNIDTWQASVYAWLCKLRYSPGYGVCLDAFPVRPVAGNNGYYRVGSAGFRASWLTCCYPIPTSPGLWVVS